MKKFSKILCAVLVIAVLCSSLIFVVGAEGGDSGLGYTAEATKDVSKIVDALKYAADDNLFNRVTPVSGTTDGWGSDGSRQSYIITNTETGDVYYKEAAKSNLTAGNEYVDYNFTSNLKLQYEEGYHEYVIVEQDIAFETVSGTYVHPQNGVTNSENLKQQLIVRGASSGTSWGAPQDNILYHKNFANNLDFVHLTTVYNFTDGNAYVFVNGELAATLVEGALTTAARENYFAKETGLYISEYRVGSNSRDTLHLDNVYVRQEKYATDADSLDAAIASGKLADWTGNIFDSSYKMPAKYWFNGTIEVAEDYGYIGNITNGQDAVNANAAGNLVTGTSRANASSAAALELGLPANGAYLNTYKVNTSGTSDPYFLFVANQDYKPGFAAGDKLNDKDGNGSGDNDNNPFISAPLTFTDFSIEEGTKALYVFELDVAAHSNMLKEANVQLEFRNNSTGGGFPFSQEVSFANYVSVVGEWARFTLVGDVASNSLYVFVNGELVGKAGYAYNAAQLVSGETALEARSARVQLNTNSNISNIDKGQSFAMDNVSEIIYADGNDTLLAAIASGSLEDWDGYANGSRAGEKLAKLAVVNGVDYYDATSLENALSTNDDIEVEFTYAPFVPVVLAANAKINTNGMDINELVTLGEGVEIVKTEGKIVYTTAPHIANTSYVQIGDGTKDPGTAAFADMKDTSVSGNLITYIAEANVGSYLTYKVTDSDNTDVYYMTSPRLEKTPGNTFYNVNFTSTPLTATSYTVLDIDVATKTDYINCTDPTKPGITLNLINRSSLLTPGTTYGLPGDGTGVEISKFAPISNEWTHLTIVADFEDNVQHVFVNGVYAGTAGMANNNENNEGQTIADHLATGKFATSSLRINVSPSLGMDLTDTLLLDNVSVRVYDSNEAAGDIEACISAGSLAGYANLATGRQGQALPVLATVNGEDYANTAALNAALRTNDKLEVEFHHVPFAPALLQASAVIDTNGMDLAKLVTLGQGVEIVAEDGDLVTTKAPYASNENVTATDKATAFNLVKFGVAGNIFDPSDTLLNNYYKENGRGRVQYIVTNTDTGDQYVRDTVDVGKTLDTNNVYIDWGVTGGKIMYELGVDQFVVFDIDFAINKVGESYNCVDDEGNFVLNGDGSKQGVHYNINLNPITRNASNGGVWGNNAPFIGDIYSAAGINLGEFAHITAAISPDTRSMYVFVNGEYVATYENAIAKVEANYYLDSIRTFSSSTSTADYDNVAIRNIKSSELAAAIADKNIKAWSGNVYTDGYELPEAPTLATVDGVEYKTAVDLMAALYGNVATPKNVEFLHVPREAIKISCDAIINTNGLGVTLEYHGGELTEVDGLIYFDCDYISSVTYNQYTGNLLDIVKSSVEGNLITGISANNYNKTAEAYNAELDAANSTAERIEVDTHKTYVASDANKTYDYLIMAPELGGAGSAPNTYINITTANYNFKAGDDTYFVIDLDFAAEGDELNLYNYFLVRDAVKNDTSWFNSGSGDLPARLMQISKQTEGDGEFIHVTLVGHAATNTLYAFANNTLVGTMPMVKEDKFENAGDTQLYIQGMRISSENRVTDNSNAWMLDNTLVRYMPVANAGNIADAIAAGDLSGWDKAVYNDSYAMPEMPVIATVDGVDCFNTSDIENAVKAEGHHDVVINASFFGDLAIDGDATVNTNKLTNHVAAANVGSYEFNTGDEWIGNNGMVTASGKYIVTVNKGVYEIATISADNYIGNSVLVSWYKVPGNFDIFEDYVYIYGHQIVAPKIEGAAFIENGKFVAPVWYDYADSTQAIISEFPVASKELGDSVSYCALKGELNEDSEVCDFAAEVKVALNVSTGFVVKLYVKASDTITVGDTVVIDGVEYLVFTSELAANELNSTVRFEFQIMDTEGNVYTQYQTIDVINDYFADILADETVDLADKNLAMAALAYANEAYALLNGAKNEAISAVLETYAEYAPEAAVPEAWTYTDDISAYVRSAALYLDATPKFVFKFAKGYNGDVQFSYVDVDGNEVIRTIYVDTTAGEELITLDGFSVYDIATSINIQLLAIEPEYAWMGSPNNNYSLADYAVGLGDENNAFAIALLTYANLASEHKLAELDSWTVAKVDGVRYASLEEALANAGNYANVVLWKDVTLNESILIDDSMTLFLNGYTVTGPEGGYAIVVDKDDALEYDIYATIYGNDSTVDSDYTAVYVVEGNLEIYGGTYIARRNNTTTESNMAALYTSTEGANVTVDGGTFIGGDWVYGIRACKGTITVKNADVNAFASVCACCGGTVYVNDGNYSATSTWDGVEADILYDAAPMGIGGTVLVSGGTFVGQNPASANNGTGTPANYVAEGYKAVDNGDGTYSIALDATAYIGAGTDWWGDPVEVTVYDLGTSLIIVDEWGNEETVTISDNGDGTYTLVNAYGEQVGAVTYADDGVTPATVELYSSLYTLTLKGEGGEGGEDEVVPEYYGTYSVTTTDTYSWIDLYEMTALVSGTYYFTVPAGLGVCSKTAYDAWSAPELDYNDNAEGATFELYLEEGTLFEYYVGSATTGDWLIEVSVVPGTAEGGEGGEDPVEYVKDANGLGGEYSFVYVATFELTFTPDYEGATTGTLAVVDGANAANSKTYTYAIVDGVYVFYLDGEETAEVIVTNDGYNWTFQNYSLRMPQAFTEYTAPEGGEEAPTNELVIGNNAIDAADVNFTYTATADGTLTLSAGGAVMGPVEITYSVNGGEATLLDLNTSVELALVAGDEVVVKAVASGYSTVTAAWAEASVDTGLDYTVIDVSAVTSTTLTSIDENKIKQMDQATAGDTNGYFTKEGGEAVYVTIEKDGALVEGLYFSRNVVWGFVEGTVDRSVENNGYSEHRYVLDSTKTIKSISFDYIVNGTCGTHETYGANYFELKTAAGAYVAAVTDAFTTDGEWHTFTWEPTEAYQLSNVLIKFYAFQGEFVIANLVINYAD